MSARRQRNMPDNRFRVGVRMMRVFEDDSLIQQVTKTAVPHPLHESLRQVASQLIDGDLQNQFWRCCSQGADAPKNGEHQQQDDFHFFTPLFPHTLSGLYKLTSQRSSPYRSCQ